MRSQSSKGVLTKTKTVVYHNNNNTFSFISKYGETICRLELNKEGIKYLGGREKVKKFISDIKSGKRKVLIAKETLDKLMVPIMMDFIQNE